MHFRGQNQLTSGAAVARVYKQRYSIHTRQQKLKLNEQKLVQEDSK